ncbi:hypothetical protein EMM73_00530 [Rheinheimera sediminis]|nr:hypothetical protein EMM73_00530 [Rheinheimera sp. YQF-1]
MVSCFDSGERQKYQTIQNKLSESTVVNQFLGEHIKSLQ